MATGSGCCPRGKNWSVRHRQPSLVATLRYIYLEQGAGVAVRTVRHGKCQFPRSEPSVDQALRISFDHHSQNPHVFVIFLQHFSRFWGTIPADVVVRGYRRGFCTRPKGLAFRLHRNVSARRARAAILPPLGAFSEKKGCKSHAGSARMVLCPWIWPREREDVVVPRLRQQVLFA